MPRKSVVTLPMIKAVEKTIKNSDKYPKRSELWAMLRKQDLLISRNALSQIVKYLIDNHKIIIDRGEIVWVSADNPKLKKLIRESVPFDNVQEFPSETIHGRPPMFVEKPPARLDTPFLKSEVNPIKIITQKDCALGTCPLCGWSGPDEQGVYHEDMCPWVEDALDADELRELRRTPWKGTETETIFRNGRREPI